MHFEFEVKNFSLEQTLFCGQCFRFRKVEDNKFLIFSGSNSSYVEQLQYDFEKTEDVEKNANSYGFKNSSVLKFTSSTADELFWKRYFNFDVNYDSLLAGFYGDGLLVKLIKFCGGLRILHQDPFEALLSFIISINNNIPRIQKIIENLCEAYGEVNSNGYSFPTAARLFSCSEENFKSLKMGFRAKYFVDIISKICKKDIDLQSLYYKSYGDAKKELKRLYGVGDKVSDCVLLFAYNKMEAFPVDVWVRKVINEYYKKGLSRQVLSCPGLAQQLLFYGKRNGYI